MILFKPYRSIKGFLERFTVLKIGKLHIRIHRIVSEDKTDFYHSHPFHYLSIVLRGWYVERFSDESFCMNRRFSCMLRSAGVYHRIHQVGPNTITLIFTWEINKKWDLKPTGWITKLPDGIYNRVINDRMVFCKMKGGKWYIGNKSLYTATYEQRLSIYQEIKPESKNPQL